MFSFVSRNPKGQKAVEMPLNFYQGTTRTYNTSSQSLFDLIVAEILAKVAITIQSLAAAVYRAYELNCPEVLKTAGWLYAYE